MCVVLFSVSYFHLFSLFFDLECLQCNLNLVRESEKEKNWKKNLAKLTGIFWQKKLKIYVWIYRYFSMSKIVWIQFRYSTIQIFSLSFFNIGKTIWWDYYLFKSLSQHFYLQNFSWNWKETTCPWLSFRIIYAYRNVTHNGSEILKKPRRSK